MLSSNFLVDFSPFFLLVFTPPTHRRKKQSETAAVGEQPLRALQIPFTNSFSPTPPLTPVLPPLLVCFNKLCFLGHSASPFSSPTPSLLFNWRSKGGPQQQELSLLCVVSVSLWLSHSSCLGVSLERWLNLEADKELPLSLLGASPEELLASGCLSGKACLAGKRLSGSSSTHSKSFRCLGVCVSRSGSSLPRKLYVETQAEALILPRLSYE